MPLCGDRDQVALCVKGGADRGADIAFGCGCEAGKPRLVLRRQTDSFPPPNRISIEGPGPPRQAHGPPVPHALAARVTAGAARQSAACRSSAPRILELVE